MPPRAKAKTKAPASKKEKACTIKEFKAWLEGMEEMLGTDWTPSKDQWKRIRAKIETIQNTPQEVAADDFFNEAEDATAAPRHVPRRPVPQHTGNPPPSSLTAVPIAGNGAHAPMSSEDNGRTKTPDIDTSKAPYRSSFE